MDRIMNPIMASARVLMSMLFVMAGVSMIDQFAIAHVYAVSMGLPGPVLPLVIVIVIVSALALLVGYKVRWAAVMLAGLSLASAVLLHFDIGDPSQAVLFIRNLLISGVLLVLAAADSGQESKAPSRQRIKPRVRKVPPGCCQAGC